MVTITASAGAGGTIDPTGEVTVEAGGNQVFTFTPSTGYKVDTVLVGGVAVTVTGNTYEIENVTTDTTIAVSFKEVTVVKHSNRYCWDWRNYCTVWCDGSGSWSRPDFHNNGWNWL